MMRPGRPDRPRSHAYDHGRGHLAIGHIAQLRCLQRELSGSLEKEIGKHQVCNAAHSGRRRSKRSSGKSEFGDRRVDHPLRPELLVEVFRVSESPAAFACALAEIDQVWIAPHLLADAVTHRVQPSRFLAGSVARRCRECLGGVERIGVHMQGIRR